MARQEHAQRLRKAAPIDLQWRYALDVYARPGVAPACLLLQDRLGVDVTVLLHLAYAASTRGNPADEDRLAAADATVRSWRDSVIAPLRAARRAILRDDPATSSLRDRVKDAELQAERHALALLGESLASADPVAAPSQTVSVRCVGAYYARQNGHDPALLDAPEIAAAIGLLERTLP
ncbi:TIGR02444 family protein [Verticiella sediminum]|uniref:TIGR02444 family protein n=1 Tax=Verticiella sediminum TaxID=1247510 RepID=A0A556A7R8_9BURK|nr:TIGR02444 family protein [Verticiella sediminum]TSH88915.1 TIGR02444 family protein [Verticiella sediminum]